MKREIRESIKRMYRDPLTAYGTFDYFGEGKIMIKQLLNHDFFKNIYNKYSYDDVKQWLYRDEVFQRLENDEDSFIDFIQFKKHFFPQVMQIQDTQDIAGGPGEQWEKKFMSIESNNN